MGLIGLISQTVAEYGFDLVFVSIVKQLYKQGETKTTIIVKIEKYPVSRSLKFKLKDELNKV